MKHLTSLILTALVTCVFVGCTDDLFIDTGNSFNIDESNIIETQLGVSVNDFTISVEGTRANDEDHEEPTSDTEIMSDFEKTVDNIWVFQYGTDGNLCSYPRYYTATSSYSSADDKWDVGLSEKESTIYVVTNVNNEDWASDYTNFATIDDLMKQTLPTPAPITDMEEGLHIPMKGCVEGVVPGNRIIVVPVEHMYAKVKMRFVIDSELQQYEQVHITNVLYTNIPWYCQVGTLYDGTNQSKDGSYPSSYWTSRYLSEANNTTDPNNEGLTNAYDYVIYVPENIQGENTNTMDDKNAKATDEDTPEHASTITAYIAYIDENNAQRAASYSVCPGGNVYNNYNVRRNQVYRVTMNIGYPEEIERQPSANCLFGFAGETISFYPYYRVEAGGGYDFENYLYPTPDDGSGKQGKKIGGLKIIWQTKNCIGDNSGGDLVYLVSTAGKGTHNGYEQIYVKTQEEGNALIAAYEDEECKGDIIWSWHIWVRTRGYIDPTNLANAYAYYTYDWDNTGIYSYDYYTNLNMTPVRVPGYQIMSCNLGALQDEPVYGANEFFGHHYEDGSGNINRIQYFEDGDGIVRTFGMLYQWGRKDPFPPMITTNGTTDDTTESSFNTGFFAHDYNDEHTGNHYGNDNSTVVHKTSYGPDGPSYTGSTNYGSGQYLFYTHQATSGEGVAYSIKNPTVFMCGLNEIGYTLLQVYEKKSANDSSYKTYLTTVSNYPYEGAWSEEDEDDKEWGGLVPDKNSEKYLGLGIYDDSNNEITIYDDYGTEKSIFDPCPYGWRVGSSDLWLGFTKNGVNPYDNYLTGSSDSDGSMDNVNHDATKSCLLGMTMYLGSTWGQGSTAWFPAQGFRLPDGCGYRVGGCGNYVNANTSTANRINIIHIHDRTSLFKQFESQFHYTVKSAANPVRCVRDTK